MKMPNIIKIGNSYGALISKKILDSLDIKLGDEIDLEIKDSGIYITKHEKKVFRESFIKSFLDNGAVNDKKEWQDWQEFEDEL